MYDWLSGLPADGSVHVVTPNRRLARALREAHAERQIAAGNTAWRSPGIHAVQDWYPALAERIPPGRAMPVALDEQQARVLWEDCLRAEISDPFVNVAVLARICRDTWQRLHDWELTLARVREAAAIPDQQLFARSAQRYAQRLDERELVDTAMLPGILADRVAKRSLPPPAQVWCCGFDRRAPRFESLLAALASAGSRVRHLDVDGGATPIWYVCADPEAELRAAGAWARSELARDATLRIGIVVTRLEQDAQRSADLVREGFVPGWQTSPPSVAEAVDLSYGRRLADLPAIHVALLALRWFHQALRGAEIALLLRTPFLGHADTPGRTRLEMMLREWPDRDWPIETLLKALEARDETSDAVDWLHRFRRAREDLVAVPRSVAPGAWAERFEAVLRALDWPGRKALSSEDFQLDNRWRQLLNEFARLELVLPQITGADAVARLSGLAAETLFQAESPGAVVTLLGPLEAAGLEFDRVWLAGAVATEWPPAGRPAALIARDLQREFDMPDATPDDTARFARRVLRRILRAAPSAVLSYPLRVGDADQVPTRLAGEAGIGPAQSDPGWFAARFAGDNLVPAADRVPPIGAGERVAGGAYTLQSQAQEPFAAFAGGRLSVRPIPAFTSGIAASQRGNLIHAALASLYAELPDQAALRRWAPEERQQRIDAAVAGAFRSSERYADAVLHQLLRLERARTARLLHAVVDIDTCRDPFALAGVEARIEAVLSGVSLQLRCDRIDRTEDGALVIFDYKTGQAKGISGKNGLGDLQLVVYSCALAEPISGLALFNVAARRISIDGVGPAFGAAEEWAATLADWQELVRGHAAEMAAGDVRVNLRQGLEEARGLSLLSRYPELYRGD